MSDSAPDLEALMADVDAEARRLRESGQLGGMEHELDAVFESLAPHATDTADFGSVLEELDRTSFIDAQAPVASDVLGGAAVKKTIRRLTGWQFDHLTRQLSAFDHAVSHALRQVDARLADLEARLPAGATSATIDLPPALLGEDWSATVADLFAGVQGRVLVVATDPAPVVERLHEAGIDAYGLDPALPALQDDVKAGDAMSHLDSVAEGALGGAVVLGWADRLTVVDVQTLAQRVAVAVRPGGRFAVVGTNPRVWATRVPPVVADLSPGRPLHPDTWSVLLGPAGLRVDDVRWSPAGVEREGDEFALTAERAG